MNRLPLIRAVVPVVAALVAASAARAQDGLETSGKIVPFVTITDGGADTNVTETVEMDLKFKKALADDVHMNVKLDVEDTASDGDLIEEAYVRWGVGDRLNVVFGRKEVKAGQDRKLYEYDPLVHAGEQDNTLALELGITAGDRVRIYITDFKNRKATGTTGGEPDDNFMFESYAVKGEIEPATGLKLNVSYLNLHNEGYNSYVAGATDQPQFAFGLDWEHRDAGLSLFFEYLSLVNIEGDLGEDHDADGEDEHGFVDGYDSSILQLGAKYAFGPDRKAEVALSYEIQDADAAAGNPELDRTMVIFGFRYKVHEKNSVWIECICDREAVSGSRESIVQAGTTFRF